MRKIQDDSARGNILPPIFIFDFLDKLIRLGGEPRLERVVEPVGESPGGS